MQNMMDLLSSTNRDERGLLYIPSEIAKQPEVWMETLEFFFKESKKIKKFLKKSKIQDDDTTIILTGLGSLEYVGATLVNLFRKNFGASEVLSISSANILSSPRSFIKESRKYVIFHFSKSGSSPEAVFIYELIQKLSPKSYQVVITCNKEGNLLKCASQDKSSLCILLPEKSYDKSYIMTSSFTSMVFAGVCFTHIEKLDHLKSKLDTLSLIIEMINTKYFPLIKNLAEARSSRVLFLGDDSIFGAIKESSTRLIEMTQGAALSMAESFVGIRHGIISFFRRDKGLIISSLEDNNEYKFAYQRDVLKELLEKNQGKKFLLISSGEVDFEGEHIYKIQIGKVCGCIRPLVDLYISQIFSVFSSLAEGLKPDNPNSYTVVNKFNQNVSIYPYKG